MTRNKLNERDLMIERVAAAQMIIPIISGYNRAHARAMQVAAFMDIVEGKPLTEAQFHKLEREFKEEENGH